MKEKVVIKKNIININNYKDNTLNIDTYMESIVRNILDTDKSIRILKKDKYSYSVYLEDNYECDLELNNNIILFDYELKVIYNNRIITYLIDEDSEMLKINMNAYSYEKDNKNYFITKCSSVYEGTITDRCNKVYIAIENSNLNDKIFSNLLENIDCKFSLEEIYNRINNNYNRIKIVKSKLIDNKTNEIITDKLVIKDNLLEDFKLTIDNEDKKYIVEKANDNYVVTYVNSSLEDINKSYFSINNSTKFVKKLERKKSLNNRK